ncbi:MAG: poly-beta,6-N-acetyl-D-glucosamine synthase [Mycobacterium sp.]|jgi:cellulose synthase/poly-beta-1,6-N-acetylglucosamine synthase-like glycosyltransferase|nr:poly-beta,6-N-acetyl-D-glucosamine synthase [Mycobacterium sp.]
MTAALLAAVLLTVLILGANTLFWTVIGIGRRLLPRRRKASATRHRSRQRHGHSLERGGHQFENEDVAVLIPAHNEAAVLEGSLRAVAALLPPSQIHVISDGSTDHTADIAARFGVHVLDLSPNRGKAGALVAGIEHFDLPRRFKVVLLLDADTRLAPDYLSTGLPLFDDPAIVAVAGRVKCLWDPPPRTRMGRFLVSYRSRVYALTQLLVKYGQAARWANVVSIVPGFASMYRTDILHHIDIAAPGLVIEDFNMTFEVHAKKLGRIAFHPDTAVAFTQDPDTWHDYVGQIRRWTLGYWQTVRRHGLLHIGRFWVALSLQVAELISSSVILLTMLPLMLLATYSETLANRYGNPKVMGLEVIGTLAPYYVVFGFLLPDLALTVFAAFTLRRPGLLLVAPVFPFMRIVEAYVCLRAIPMSVSRTQSSGRWISPTRRKATSPSISGRHRISGRQRPSLTATSLEGAA